MSAPICPSCGLKNPEGTPKCRCGRVLPPPTSPPQAQPPAKPASPPPTTPALPPGAPDALIPKTEIRRLSPPKAEPQAPAHGVSLPQAGRSEQNFAPANATPLPRAAQKTPRPEPTAPGSRSLLPGGAAYFVKSVAALLFLVLLGGGGALLYMQKRAASRPEVVVPQLAKNYLEALSHDDFATAYAMLSPQAQAQSSLEEFQQLRDTTPWTWDNIETVSVEPDAIIVRYDLMIQGKPSQKDYLTFVLQDGRWVRPYTWGLLKKIEQAFDRNDPDMAMLQAQAAVSVDPRDPMVRGYLCEALYYRKLSDAAQRECETALQLAGKYPSKLTGKSLYHLHAILGDTYKNSLRRFDKAAEEYGLMLNFPNLSADDQCALLLARADAYLQMTRNTDASGDLTRASSVCTKPEDLQFIERKRAELPH